VEHQPGGYTVAAVRVDGCDGVVEQAARAPVLRMPMINARIIMAATQFVCLGTV